MLHFDRLTTDHNVRSDIAETFEREWKSLRRPGSHFSSHEKIQVCERARRTRAGDSTEDGLADVTRRVVDTIAARPATIRKPWVEDVTANLVAKDRAELLAQVITDEATPAAEILPGQGAQLPPPPQRHISAVPIEGRHTTHLSVIDADGNAVSMTTTVNYSWGSCVVARGTGVVLLTFALLMLYEHLA